MFDAYLTNTWIAGTVVALSAGIIGVFVVLRGDSFLAHAIPHGSFAGAAAAVYLGVSSVVGMGLAAFAAAVGISVLGRKKQRRDTVIVGTVSCIYGIGDPSDYFDMRMVIRARDRLSQREGVVRSR